MRCPYCQHQDTRVVDSRPSDGGTAIRRRRECLACAERFSTYERPALAALVMKRDGASQAFDPDKVRRGIEAALADRPVSAGAVNDIVGAVQTKVHESRVPVETDEIGRIVLEALKDIDQVAYLRFASVYKEFQEAQDFEREMAALDE